MRGVQATDGGVPSPTLPLGLCVVLAAVSVLSFMFPSVGTAQSGTTQTTQAKQSTQQKEPTPEGEFKTLLQKADQGDATAQTLLGAMYVGGKGVPKDYAQAVTWFRKAAEQGLAGAQVMLGMAYELGLGVPQDYVQAVAWYRKAAEQGDARGQFPLGAMYFKGQGIPQDYEQAASWYRKAAEQGNARAQYELGVACTTMGKASRRMWRRRWRGIGRRRSRDTRRRSTTWAPCTPLDKVCRRTTGRL